jgi:hypothetical protein
VLHRCPPPTGCHLYFARRVTFLSCADSILAQKLSQMPGVGLVSIGGQQNPAIRVQVNPAQLAAQGIDLEAVRRRWPLPRSTSRRAHCTAPIRPSRCRLMRDKQDEASYPDCRAIPDQRPAIALQTVPRTQPGTPARKAGPGQARRPARLRTGFADPRRTTGLDSNERIGPYREGRRISEGDEFDFLDASRSASTPAMC